MREWSLRGHGTHFITAQDVESDLAELRRMPDVDAIDISGNIWGIDAVEPFAKILGTLRSLKRINLADIFTTRDINELPRSLKAICDALEETPIETIDLSSLALGPRAAPPVASFLQKNRTYKSIRIVDNGLGPTGGAIIADALTASAHSLDTTQRHLQTLIISNNRLGWNLDAQNDAPKWYSAIRAHAPTLQDVQLYSNSIRADVMSGIIGALSSCANLRHLDVSDNWLRIPGARALARALPSWPELRVLNISDDQILPRGGVIIMTALANGSSPKLEELYVKESEIDGKAFEVLAAGIKRHYPQLVKLEVNGNYGSEDDDWVTLLREALAIHAHEEALGEVDELEGRDDDEEEEEEQDEEEEGEDVGDAQGKLLEKAPPAAVDQEVAELADLMKEGRI